jgi:hypothetical protein
MVFPARDWEQGKGGGVKPTWNKGLNVIIDTHGTMPTPQEFHLNMVCKLQDFQLIML